MVPYSPWLQMKYDAHICVDLITDRAVIAYLCKYCFKLADYLRARILYNNNEIKAYRSVRYISSSDAMWHIFGFRTHFRTPSVNLLFVHLPNEQPVVYDEADDLEERMRKANGSISDLMRCFGRPVFAEFSALTSVHCYEQYSVEQDQRHPSNRRRISINNDNSDQEDQVVQSTHHRDRYQNYVYKKTKPNVSRL